MHRGRCAASLHGALNTWVPEMDLLELNIVCMAPIGYR